jgi:hypothetical protein
MSTQLEREAINYDMVITRFKNGAAVGLLTLRGLITCENVRFMSERLCLIEIFKYGKTWSTLLDTEHSCGGEFRDAFFSVMDGFRCKMIAYGIPMPVEYVRQIENRRFF